MHYPTDVRVCVVHQLEACSIRLTLLKLCQVDVQEPPKGTENMHVTLWFKLQ